MWRTFPFSRTTSMSSPISGPTRKCRVSKRSTGPNSPFYDDDHDGVDDLTYFVTCSVGNKHVCTHCISLLFALVLVELQNTGKKKLNRKMLERPNICYNFWKVGGSRMSNMTFPQPIQLVPTMQKSSLRELPENWVHKGYCYMLIFFM